MAGGPEARLLDDGRRLHLHHGPIDLVVGADGAETEVARSYRQAADRFQNVLSVLVEDLQSLRQPVAEPRWRPAGPVARRMMEAVWPHRGTFVTPMAAVAGSVADEVLAAMVAGRDLKTAYVNNSGDIAFHVAPGESLRLGVVGDLHRAAIDGFAELTHDMPVRGVATSGWTGRSWSFGIADAVTVLARNAAAADVAATLIANAVDVDDPAVERRPAREMDDDTDLGDRPVTVSVGALSDGAIASALDAGERAAKRMVDAGLVISVVLVLQGRTRVVGHHPAAIAA